MRSRTVKPHARTPLAGRLTRVATALLITTSTGVTAMADEGPAPAPPQRQVLATGHADLVSVFLEAGSLVVAGQSDVDRATTRFDPARTTVNVTDAALRAAPRSPAYAFLGVPAGTPIHVVPQAFQPGVLWAGWNTESVPRGALVGDAVDITLRAARGPGRVEVYLSGVDGPERVWSSHDAGPRTRRVAVPTHAHANWAFTAPGVYELEFAASATASSGTPLTSAPVRYVVVVGPLATTPTTTALDVADTADGLLLTGRVTGGPEHLHGGSPSGWLEFHGRHADRDEVVGHVAVDGGRAVLRIPPDTSASAYTARFVPEVQDLVTPSWSPAVANPRARPSVAVIGVRDRYAVGETVAATASVTPPRPDHTVAWWTRKGTATTPRGTGGALTLAATADLDDAELGFDLVDAEGDAVTSARGVALRVDPTTPPSTAPPSTTLPSTAPTVSPPPSTTATPCVPNAVTRAPGTDGPAATRTVPETVGRTANGPECVPALASTGLDGGHLLGPAVAAVLLILLGLLLTSLATSAAPRRRS